MVSQVIIHIFIIKNHNNYGDIMLNKIRELTVNSCDYIFREIKLSQNIINLICLETLTSTDSINDYILKRITLLNEYDEQNLTNYLYNHLPVITIKEVNNIEDIFDKLLNGFVIVLINDQKALAIETRKDLTRGINEANYERTITGPKDSFNEHFNTNVGLIRRRIKSPALEVNEVCIGRYSKTKIGVILINSIAKKELKQKIITKLKEINIDGIIDSGYLKNYLNEGKSIFPTIKSTERPDLACQSLLEGKIVIISDNSPDILILPTFFIDYFHTSDDYYQKSLNISFIRLIRLIAFIFAIFLPSYYIAITTHNIDFIPINLLINFVAQRSNVPFPAVFEAFIMIISFEILRESDMRIPSSMGTAISILGGLVLGDAAVAAGIVSPIMIIVIAISAISGLLFQSIEVINAIRWWRFLLMILASLFGLYGIFIGIILIFTNLSNTKSFSKDYLYPYAPINFTNQKDGFIRKESNIKKRNPLLTNNKIRGYK